MMRILYVLLPLFVFCVPLCGQVLQIEYNGDPLSKEEREKVEKMFLHEAEFYSQFGLPDTLTVVHLYVFDKKKAAMLFLESLDVKGYNYAAGLYLPKRNKVIILGMERGRKETLPVIYHELSHHFVWKVLSGRAPIWFNEGLSEYFEKSIMTKKGIRHSLTEYEQGRIRTMYMLGEIDLPAFVNSEQGEFMIDQISNEQYSYILAHGLVTFWIEKLPRDLLKKFVATLKDGDKSLKVSEQIDNIYPGGFSQFEKDFAEFVNNDN